MVIDAAPAEPPDAAPVAVDAAAPGVGDAAKAAYPELLDLHKRWIFEVVAGSAIGKLKPVKNLPHVFGYVAPLTADGSLEQTYFTTRADGKYGFDFAAVTGQTIGIVFDDDGVRQFAGWMNVGDKSNLRGFTFPLEVPATIERDTSYGTIVIEVTKQDLPVAGETRAVLVASTKMTEDKTSSYEVHAYAPGLGPALLCPPTYDRRDLLCLRLISTDERLCAQAAAQACQGQDAAACDDALRQLLIDPDDGKPRTSKEAEANCGEMLAK